ncbi:AMP-dependent synthetase/ligase [Hwanghaeella sp. 1Z406]|uniref:AMP-dependent synthetase/ligase n=1 Tax=Hwanghaeella sp. 1Z406 TaxID=3402811 RepID=UPI00268E26CA
MLTGSKTYTAAPLPPAPDMPDIDVYDTFPKLLRYNAVRLGDQPSMREKSFGIWQSWTWSQVKEEIYRYAAGMKELGVQRGDKIAIIGDNRPRMYWTICMAQCLGAVPVPIYQDSVAEEILFPLEHAEVRFAVVEDQEQVDKLLIIKDRLPKLETIVYDEERGIRDYTETFLHSYRDTLALGDLALAKNSLLIDDEIDQGTTNDISIIPYTSGTTGNPKGVLLSYRNVMRAAYNGARFEGLKSTDQSLAYLPIAWIGDHIFSYGQAYICGFCVACPESSDTVLTDLRELGPSYFFAPPRIFENILTTVMIRMEDASAIKRKVFNYFMDHARRVGVKILDGHTVGLWDRFLYALGGVLVYGPLKNVLGFSRVRVGYTAGEAIGPDIFSFYRSIGINLKQLYGSTEAAVFVTIQPNGEIYDDTVGTPAPEVELRIADNGEVLFRSPGVFVEYFKNEAATKETKTADGWVHTGDAGFMDDRGHLKIIDRAKDVGKLNNGTLFAPKYIENKLKFFPNIKEVVAFGNGRDYCACFINIDLEAVGSWAERNNLSYASFQDLSSRREVYDIIKGHVEQVNRDLAQEEMVAGSQITRFLLLPKMLDADDGELTRTSKVRRSFIAEKYASLIDALYDPSAKTGSIKSEITFEDGRKGMLEATVDIYEATQTPPSHTSTKVAQSKRRAKRRCQGE